MDKGIWRRIKIVPWEVSIPDDEKGLQLLAKLEFFLEGILAWCVRGCLEWQRMGLAPPPEVKAETEEYREEMDVLAGFIADSCVEGPDYTVKSDPLYVEYKKWCDLNGERQEPQNKFAVRMKEREYEKKRKKSGVVWTGLQLRDGEDPTPGVPPDVGPTPAEIRIDKPDSEDVQRKGVGYVPDSGLTAEIPTRVTGVNPKTPIPPYTPTPSSIETRLIEEVGE